MTRKEQIEKQAADFADRHGFRVPYDGSNDFYDHVDVKASMDGFIAGAEFADRTMLEKACKWLEENVWGMTGVDYSALTESFTQAMEE